MIVTDSTGRSGGRSGSHVLEVASADPGAVTHASLCGRVDDDRADALAHEVIDIVFALPTTDVELDLRNVDELCPAGVDTIRNAHLALEDQGAHLTVLCGPDLEQRLRRTGASVKRVRSGESATRKLAGRGDTG